MGSQEDRDLAARLAAAEERIAELEADREDSSGVDTLTGLTSLREFCVQLDVELGRTGRRDGSLSVALIDVDDLAQINATHGVAVGDEVMRSVGCVLARYLRAYDLACRTAGDEFAVMLPDTELRGAFKCFERIKLELDLHGVGPVHGISLSVGLATLDPKVQTSVKLLSVAAQALDRARAVGGARVLGPALAER